jgi:hypothetical protein
MRSCKQAAIVFDLARVVAVYFAQNRRHSSRMLHQEFGVCQGLGS